MGDLVYLEGLVEQMWPWNLTNMKAVVEEND